MPKKLTKYEFIEKAKKIHGDKYDYSKVEYVNSQTKVCIICPEHGEFWMKPNDHLSRKYGCHKCGWIDEGKNLRKKTETFIEEAKKKHGNKFDYSKVNYVKNNEKVCIISHEKDSYGIEIGEFWQTPSNHLTFGYGEKNIVVDTKRFIQRSKKIHGDLYDYSKTEFKSSRENVIITCPIHGDFSQLPHTHLNGYGCPRCKCKSRLESKIREIIGSKKIIFEEQKRFEWMNKKSLDFYFPEYNMAIECQGKQHLYETGQWEPFETILNRDIEKYNLCKEHNIKIIYVLSDNEKKIPDFYNDKIKIKIKDFEKALNELLK